VPTRPPTANPNPPLTPNKTQAPAGAVVLLGLYMLTQLVWGVATFESCPGEADALRKVGCWR